MFRGWEVWFVCMDVVAVISSCFRRSKDVKVLEYMFHGGCRRVSRVLSLALEPIYSP